jgi:cell wall-associated NlpC family hydrolase
MNKKKRDRTHHASCFFIIPVFLSISLFSSFCSVRTKPDKVWHLRDKVVTLAKSLTGLPYKYGGDDIDGLDCSGLVYYVYSSFGMSVPRTAKKQGKLKSKVKFKKAKPGDILVFKLKRRRWHSGILINKKYFIHAPNRKETVREESLNSYWRSRLRAVIGIINE